ncbi:MAG: hypothetical protein WDM96_03390 [Lacunisphaera sp.]
MLYVFSILNALAIGSVIYHRKAIRRYYWPDILGMVALTVGPLIALARFTDRHFSETEIACVLMAATAVNAYTCGRIVGRRRPLTEDGRVDWDKITSQQD